MEKQIQEFFFDEQDRGHLVFEDDPQYADLLYQSLSLLETANCISFAHGLKLGLRLREWTAL